MARNYAALPYEYKREMAALNDAEFGRLCRALIEYSESGVPITLTGNERFYAERVMMQEDRFKASYAEQAEKLSNRGKSGAQARWSNATDAKACLSMPSNAKHGNTETETNTETKTNTPNGVNTPHNPPKGFSEFWRIYPRKVGKQAALKAWSKLKPSAELTQAILQAVEYQRTSPQWTKDGGQYIPNPATWLNQGRWEDEVTGPVKPSWDIIVIDHDRLRQEQEQKMLLLEKMRGAG